jgi:hypothetical protein
MENLLDNYEILHTYSENVHLTKTNVKTLLETPIVRWRYNRPPDMTRCQEIKEHMTKQDTFINMPFHLFYNETYEEFECLDGLHRYTALCEAVKDGCSELINDKTVICYIYSKLKIDELKEIFRGINKSVAVPELYISNEYDQTDKTIIENVVKSWESTYKSHFSSNHNFNAPNINRDSLISLLTEVYSDYKVRTEQKMMEMLIKANEFIKSYVEGDIVHYGLSKSYTQKQLEKCVKTGCYLFLFKDSKLKERVFPKIRNIM